MENDGRVYEGRQAGAAQKETDRNWRRLRRKRDKRQATSAGSWSPVRLSVFSPTTDEAAEVPIVSQTNCSKQDSHSAKWLVGIPQLY